MPISARNRVRMLNRERERLRVSLHALEDDVRRAYPYSHESRDDHAEAITLINRRLAKLADEILTLEATDAE